MNKNSLLGVHGISFSHCLQLCFAVMLTMASLFFYYVWAEKQVDAANQQRYATRLISGELRI